ncbi:hypothetical protein XENOCAPTIV_002596, partial [Xenoophorus captivus]
EAAVYMFSMKRCPPGISPSHKRYETQLAENVCRFALKLYIEYMCDMMAEEPIIPHSKPVIIHSIIMTPVPLFNKQRNGTLHASLSLKPVSFLNVTTGKPELPRQPGSSAFYESESPPPAHTPDGFSGTSNQGTQEGLKAASSNSDLLNDLFAPPAGQTGAVQEDLFFSEPTSGATPDSKREEWDFIYADCILPKIFFCL